MVGDFLFLRIIYPVKQTQKSNIGEIVMNRRFFINYSSTPIMIYHPSKFIVDTVCALFTQTSKQYRYAIHAAW